MRAIEQYQKALALDSSLAEARIRLGYVYAVMIRSMIRGLLREKKPSPLRQFG